MVGVPDETRPSPDALLEAAQKETRGKLKIFLGAAPGVGKTYEMLQTARRRKAEGIDVVIGVADTHGRAETRCKRPGPARRPVYSQRRSPGAMALDVILAPAGATPSTSCPHNARQPPCQALPGRRGTAYRRYRRPRTLNAACREPERRGARITHPRARDGA